MTFNKSTFLFVSEQWKPINTEEKKKYDREFLLGFQFKSASMNKPEGLPAISDVVLDKVQTFTIKTQPSVIRQEDVYMLHCSRYCN